MTSWNPDANDSSDDEFDSLDVFKGREAVIYVLDAFLFIDNREAFVESLTLIQNAFLSGILTQEKDLIGIIFFNTKESPDPKDVAGIKNIVVSKNTSVFLPLKQLSKEIVNYFLNFGQPDHFDFVHRFGFEQGSLANTLRMCTNIFKQCGFKLSTSTIILFTARDEPHSIGTNEFQKAMQRAKDLEETDIQLQLIPMIEDFDYNKFYKEFLCIIDGIDITEFELPNIEREKKLVANRNLKQNFKKNCQYHLKWTLGDGIQLSVALYNYFKKSVYAKMVKLYRADSSIVEVKRVSKISIPDVENPENVDEKYLKPGDERKALSIGGRRAVFTSDEISKMRSPLAPGIRLLGFKPKTAVLPHMYSRPCSFLYPDENVINGSTVLFRALWEKCLEKEQIAICVMVSRRKSPPRFVALIPVERNPEFEHKQNDGFHIFFLPFENDYRNLRLHEFSTPEYSDNGIEIFTKIVKKLKIKYNTDLIKDPYLEVLHNNLIGLAFDIELEGSCNGTMPDGVEQDKRIERFIENLPDVFGEDLESARKRPRADDGGGNAAKVVKISEECPSQTQILDLIATDQLQCLTIKQLKNYLQSNNVKGIASLTKPILIQKVKDLNNN